MDAQTVPQTPTTVRQTLVRYRWAIALGLLVAVAALVAYRFTSVPLVATSVVSVWQAPDTDPAQHGVLDELRAHVLVQPLSTPVAPLDPAQQSVMSYLRAHESVERSTAPWDPAVQAVLSYLRAHTR